MCASWHKVKVSFRRVPRGVRIGSLAGAETLERRLGGRDPRGRFRALPVFLHKTAWRG